MNISSLPLAEACGYVIDACAVDLAPGSRNRFAGIYSKFARYAMATAGVDDPRLVDGALVLRFIQAPGQAGPAAQSTVATRLSAIRFLFHSLRVAGLVDHDPTMDLRACRGESQPIRALTDADVKACRDVTQWAMAASDRWTVSWALLESGVSTGEVGSLSVENVSPEGTWITVPGTSDSPGRTLGTSPWARAALLRSSGDLPVTRSSTHDSRRTAVTHILRQIFDRAGLLWAQPRSLTAWKALAEFKETGRIEIAARTIGLESLDRTAALIGLNWRDEAR